MSAIEWGYPLQELVEYYREHSLRSVIPDITTPLKYPYYIISTPPKRPINLPWPVSSATLPPGIEALTLSEKEPVEIRNEVSMILNCVYIHACNTFTPWSKN